MVRVTDNPMEHSDLLKALLLVHLGDMATTTWTEKSTLGAEERDTGLQGKGKHQKRGKKG